MFRRLRLLAVALIAAAAVFAAGAAAEMPSNRDAPTVTTVAAPVVGQPLVGNNGTWLYDDGSACRDECRYAFAWQRCDGAFACEPIAGALERIYRVAPADVGRSLRVAVTATKYDCNARGVDCRNVTRTALSTPTAPVPAPPPAPVRLTIAGVSVVPGARRTLVVRLRITDGVGRAIRSGRVRVSTPSAASSARIRSDGSARVTLRRPTRASASLSIRADRPGDPTAVPVLLAVRVPLPR
jgi:hypothetical protein